MTRVLVTGAAGFVGRQIVRALAEDGGYEIHAVVRKPAILAGAHVHQADILDQDAVRALCRDVAADLLIHAAWYVEHGLYWNAPENTAWVLASEFLVREFSRCGGRRAVGVGTMAEYDWSAPQPMNEASTPLRPATLYGRCKLQLFEQLQGASRNDGFEFAWARLFNLFGAQEGSRRLVPHIIQSLLAGEPARCTHGRQIRDFMDVAEAGRAIAELATSRVCGAVNVASGTPVSQATIVRRLGDLCGRPELIMLGAVPAPPQEPGELCADIARLRDEVGFAPRETLDAGLRRTVDFWREVRAASVE